jgi:hypothetical protein
MTELISDNAEQRAFTAAAMIPWGGQWPSESRITIAVVYCLLLVGFGLWELWCAIDRARMRGAWHEQEMEMLARTSFEARARACWLSGQRRRDGGADRSSRPRAPSPSLALPEKECRIVNWAMAGVPVTSAQITNNEPNGSFMSGFCRKGHS